MKQPRSTERDVVDPGGKCAGRNLLLAAGAVEFLIMAQRHQHQPPRSAPRSARHSRYLFPPRVMVSLCFVLYGLVSIGLTQVLSLPWQAPLPQLPSLAAGGLLLGLGMVLQIWSFKSLGLKRALGRELFLSQSESKLVTSGMYAHSRHPLYLAATLLLLGLFLLIQLTPLGFLTIFFVGHFLIAARWEERELQQRFGAEYDAYSRRVPQFIPRWPGRGSESAGKP